MSHIQTAIVKMYIDADNNGDMEMKVYETEMGFTPAARSRISAPSESPRDNDPWSDIAG